MGTAASLSVYTFNVHDSERISRHNTSLVERETILALCFGLVHESLCDLMTIVNKSIGGVLNLLLLLTCQTLEMGDVQVSFSISLFGTCLPNMWSENFAA